MFCRKCGEQISDSALFCKFCGTKVEVKSTSETLNTNTYAPTTNNVSVAVPISEENINRNITLQEYYKQYYPQEERYVFNNNMIWMLIMSIIICILNIVLMDGMAGSIVKDIIWCALAIVAYWKKNIYCVSALGIYGVIYIIMSWSDFGYTSGNSHVFHYGIPIALGIIIYRSVVVGINLNNYYKCFQNGIDNPTPQQDTTDEQ